jgi:hypothetical protein
MNKNSQKRAIKKGAKAPFLFAVTDIDRSINTNRQFLPTSAVAIKAVHRLVVARISKWH